MFLQAIFYSPDGTHIFGGSIDGTHIFEALRFISLETGKIFLEALLHAIYA